MNVDERAARDRAFKASDGCSVREGQIWDAAWAAARDYYAPNADLADDLRDRILPRPTETERWAQVPRA